MDGLNCRAQCAMRAMLAPNAMLRTAARADLRHHRRQRPVRGLASWVSQGARLAAQQAIETIGHSSLLPPPDHRLVER
jgi:hypothetical protein